MHGSDAARQVGLGALEGSFKEGVEVLRSTALVLRGEVALLAGLSWGARWEREHVSPLPTVWYSRLAEGETTHGAPIVVVQV